MRFVWVVALAACGRVGFDARTDAARTQDGAPDVAGDVGADVALPSDLAAWFPLDDNQFTDVVGGSPGICAGPACNTFVPGHSGMAIHLDGATCISITDAGQFDPAAITVSIWANEDSPLQLRECQVSKRVDIGANIDNSWELETTGTADQESFTSNHGATGNDQVLATTAIQPSVWQHLVATFDGASEVIYVDGVLINSAGQNNPLGYDSNAVVIGCDDNGGFSEHFVGALDELRVYKRALSPAEVQALP